MQQMKREDYKAVKHMNKERLTAYLQRVYMRGFNAGAVSSVGKGTQIPAPPQAAAFKPGT